MKQSIKNRKGQNVVVVVHEAKKPRGLVFVMHGLGGFKEQPIIQTFTEAFREKDFTTVLFDTTNTFGESEGNYEDATITNYYEDLEDVIEWAGSQPWYQEPFCLAGHSLGGICTALYTEKHPNKVQALAPISTVVSGKLSMETDKHKSIAEEWKKTGWRVTKGSTTGKVKRLKWSHMEDRLKYDLLPDANKLKMPVLLIVGDQDSGTLPEHQRLLYDTIPSEKKEFHIIENAPHTFTDPSHLKEIKNIFLNWIDTFAEEKKN